MKTGRVAIAVLIVIIVITAFISITGRNVNAQASGPSDPAVLEKLERVLENQKSIMESLASIKEELNIVKLRISQNQ